MCPSCRTPSSVAEGLGGDPAPGCGGPVPVRLVWRKRRWRCRTPSAGGARSPSRCRSCRRGRGSPPGSKTAAGRAVAVGGRTITQAGRDQGLSWPIVSAAFAREATAMLPAEPEPVTALGIDETRRGKPRFGARPRHRAPSRIDRPLAHRVRRPDRRPGPARAGRGPRQRPMPDPGWPRAPSLARRRTVRGDRHVLGLPGRRTRAPAATPPWSSTISTSCSWPTRRVSQRAPPGHRAAARTPRPRQDDPEYGHPATAAAQPRGPDRREVHRHVEPADRSRPARGGDPVRLDRQGRTPRPARLGPHPPDPPPDLRPGCGRSTGWCADTDIPELHRLAATIEALVAPDRGVHPHRHHQRRQRGHQPADQARSPQRLRVPQPHQPTPPITLRNLGGPEFSGQLVNCWIMLRAAGSGTRCGPLAGSGSRVPSGDVVVL